MKLIKKQIEPFFFEAGPRAVVLFHSYTGSSNDNRVIARALQRAGYTVYGPNFSGHGNTDVEQILAESPEVWYEDAKEAIVQLKSKGYNQIAAFGLSMGGIMATKLLEEEPSLVGGGVFASPLFSYKEDTERISKALLAYSKTVMKAAGKSDEEIQAAFPKISEEAVNQLNDLGVFKIDIVKNFNKIHTPFFIAQAMQDELVSAQQLERLEENLRGQVPISYHRYPNSKHVITVGADRKKMEEDLLNFLDTLEWKVDL